MKNKRQGEGGKTLNPRLRKRVSSIDLISPVALDHAIVGLIGFVTPLSSDVDRHDTETEGTSISALRAQCPLYMISRGTTWEYAGR
jgi:hypothetical protein